MGSRARRLTGAHAAAPRAPLRTARKRDRAAQLVRDMIADGTLKPGAPVPSGDALAGVTGFAVLTCRAALRLLAAEGTLVPGPSPAARLRVALAPGDPARDAGELRAALSRELSARRRAAGLRQAEVAEKTGFSLTTVGHAETGRTWQSRVFWERAGQVLGDGGELLRLHGALRQAEAAQPAVTVPVIAEVTPGGAVVLWPCGQKTVALPPGRQG